MGNINGQIFWWPQKTIGPIGHKHKHNCVCFQVHAKMSDPQSQEPLIAGQAAIKVGLPAPAVR